MIKNFLPTKKGIEYIAEALSDKVCVFTRGSFGDGILAADMDPTTLTDLISPKGPLIISNQTAEDGVIGISTQFSNMIDGQILSPFYLTEVGIFGKLKNASGQDDPAYGEELLIYGYISTNQADYIQDVLNEFIINFPLGFSESPNIEILVDKSMAYPTRAEFDETKEEIGEIQNDVSHGVDGRGTGAALTATFEMELIDGLRLTVKLPANLNDDATFAYNGGAALPIVGMDGEPISSGAKKGTFIDLIYSKSDKCWYMMNSDATKRSVVLKNVSVEKSAWDLDTTFEEFPYRATILCAGITAETVPAVTFGIDDAVSGMFAPLAGTDKDSLYIYAKEIPASTIVIQTVELRNAKSMKSPLPEPSDDDGNADNEVVEDLIEELFGSVIDIADDEPKTITLAQFEATIREIKQYINNTIGTDYSASLASLDEVIGGES